MIQLICINFFTSNVRRNYSVLQNGIFQQNVSREIFQKQGFERDFPTIIFNKITSLSLSLCCLYPLHSPCFSYLKLAHCLRVKNDPLQIESLIKVGLQCNSYTKCQKLIFHTTPRIRDSSCSGTKNTGVMVLARFFFFNIQSLFSRWYR